MERFFAVGIWLPIICVVLVWRCAAEMECGDSEFQDQVGRQIIGLNKRIKTQAAKLNGINTDPENCYLDGDTLVNDASLARFLLRDLQGRQKRTLYDFDAYPRFKWTTNPILYVNPPDIDDAARQVVAAAFRQWSDVTCLRFEERDLLQDDTPHIGFRLGGDCISFTGMGENNAPHVILVAPHCFHLEGRISHLIGHTLGLWHEHQRPDRDDYVTVNSTHAQPGEEANFVTLPAAVVDTNSEYSDYDYGSIMHYEQTRFSVDGEKPTISPINELYAQTIGQLVEPSFWDVAKINHAYCADACPGNTLQCENRGYVEPNDCDKCVCPEGFGGVRCQDRAQYRGEVECGNSFAVEDSSPLYIMSSYYGDEGRYPTGQKCTWDITSPPNTRMRASFAGDFEVFCRENVAFHYVEIRHTDDMIKTGPRFCGTSAPSSVVESTGNQMKILFNSVYNNQNEADTGVPAGQNRGFKIKIQLVLDSTPCDSSPCMNGGSCLPDDDDFTTFSCVCDDEYTGLSCESRVDPCSNSPCHNNGSCIPVGNNFTCACMQGFTGDTCEENGVCGGCGQSGGERPQMACQTSELVDTMCVREERVQYDDCHKHWWSWIINWCETKWKTVEEYYPCSTQRRFCCDNALMEYEYGRYEEAHCYVSGWGEWQRSCWQSGLKRRRSACGGCGRQYRYDYTRVSYGGHGWWYHAGTEARACGFRTCSRSDCKKSPIRYLFGRKHGRYCNGCEVPCCDPYVERDGECVLEDESPRLEP